MQGTSGCCQLCTPGLGLGSSWMDGAPLSLGSSAGGEDTGSAGCRASSSPFPVISMGIAQPNLSPSPSSSLAPPCHPAQQPWGWMGSTGGGRHQEP